jgi:hypothetical protein
MLKEQRELILKITVSFCDSCINFRHKAYIKVFIASCACVGATNTNIQLEDARLMESIDVYIFS